jgi:isopenicillin-N N-acyltransferase-like protein
MNLNRTKKILLVIVFICSLLAIWYVHRVTYKVPENIVTNIQETDLVTISSTHFSIKNSWLRLNENGNWECYIEGNGYNRGRTIGILQKELGRQQEKVFISEINARIPSWWLKKFFTLGIAWFNRDLDMYIPQEYRAEIYGISQFFSDEFDVIGPKYNRIINYHAAHDIGHAVQNMRLVGCTAFGTWDFNTSNQQMLLGRNFDFYFGDEFARNKIILLSNPDIGYKSISVTWPSFVGVVSGINENGLGITLNSDKSEMPSDSGTPVSIIAREILQYASTIDEALVICNKYKSFVSESFTISSAIDQTVVVVEKTPLVTAVYIPKSDTIIVTNHFQSAALKNSPLNIEHMNTSESVRRYDRTLELIRDSDIRDYIGIAKILRDQRGIGGRNIGMGNPIAINQLLAHHSVIFDNVKQIIWVSDYPFQLNKMEAYTLKDFANWGAAKVKFPITIDSLEIPEDPFYSSPAFKRFDRFKEIREIIVNATVNIIELNEDLVTEFISTNPEYYETYRSLGNYYSAIENESKALEYYKLALNREIAYQEDRIFIEAQISEIDSND